MHAIYRLRVILDECVWSVEAKRAALALVELADLRAFVAQLLQQVYIEVLAIGNIQSGAAVAMMQEVVGILQHRARAQPLCLEQRRRWRCLALPGDADFTYSHHLKIRQVSAAGTYYQIGLENVRETARLELIHQIISEACFNQLRTREQLGRCRPAALRRVGWATHAAPAVQDTLCPASCFSCTIAKAYGLWYSRRGLHDSSMAALRRFSSSSDWRSWP